jgi:hypothetical protein
MGQESFVCTTAAKKAYSTIGHEKKKLTIWMEDISCEAHTRWLLWIMLPKDQAKRKNTTCSKSTPPRGKKKNGRQGLI